MFVDFNKIFKQEIDWTKIKLIDNSPCIGCPSKINLRQRHPGCPDDPPECDRCAKYALWMMHCIEKLAWYESKEK